MIQPHQTHVYDSKRMELSVPIGSIATLGMQTRDWTLADAALFSLQGSLSARRDSMIWVLTGSIPAAAMMSAAMGWLAAGFSKTNFLIPSLAGFASASLLGIASLLGGAWQNLSPIAAMLFCRRRAMKMAARLIMSAAAGLLLWPLWAITTGTLDAGVRAISWVSLVPPVGMGLVFVPSDRMAFVTLPHSRTDGAVRLMRNDRFGDGAGLDGPGRFGPGPAGGPGPSLQPGVGGPRVLDKDNPQIPFGLANLNSLIEYRAQVHASANDFLLMFQTSLPVFAIFWLMRRPSLAAGQTPKVEAVQL